MLSSVSRHESVGDLHYVASYFNFIIQILWKLSKKILFMPVNLFKESISVTLGLIFNCIFVGFLIASLVVILYAFAPFIRNSFDNIFYVLFLRNSPSASGYTNPIIEILAVLVAFAQGYLLFRTMFVFSISVLPAIFLCKFGYVAGVVCFFLEYLLMSYEGMPIVLRSKAYSTTPEVYRLFPVLNMLSPKASQVNSPNSSTRSVASNKTTIMVNKFAGGLVSGYHWLVDQANKTINSSRVLNRNTTLRHTQQTKCEEDVSQCRGIVPPRTQNISVPIVYVR